MSANKTIEIALLRGRQRCQLKPANKGSGLTYAAFDPGRQRPVGLALQTAQGVEPAVQPQQQAVGMVTHQQHQGAASHHLVELITVAYQKTAAIRGGMHGLVEKLHTGEGLATEATEEFIVVTGHIDNAEIGRASCRERV